MKKILALLLAAVCLLLCGCNLWMDGQYYHVTPHEQDNGNQVHEAIRAESYSQVKTAMENQIEAGNQKIVITYPSGSQTRLKAYMDDAIRQLQQEHPITAYAVGEITYELGTSDGEPAVAVTVSYIHNRSQILRIKHVEDMAVAAELIGTTLDACDGNLVLQVKNYTQQDITGLVHTYVSQNPHTCMEMPQVTWRTYPESGDVRILELNFTYRSDKQTLLEMQDYVSPIFVASSLNVSGEEDQGVKFARMYAFLMERSDYRIEPSVTPAYSLLRYGVGDSKAFADVFGAMCRRAGLDCRTVSGTYSGEARYWNIICQDGVYYHVDLLQSAKLGQFHKLSAAEMKAYSWDLSLYPQSGTKMEAAQ